MVTDVPPANVSQEPATGAAPANPNAGKAPTPGGRLISVLEDAAIYNIKHPLQYNWSLWLKKADSKSSQSSAPASSDPSAPVVHKTSMEIWKESVEHLGANVQTVEDFWCLFNNIPPVHQLPHQADYFFFKEGIVPAWEDPHHHNGGMITVTLNSSGRDAPKPASTKSAEWEGLWLNAMLACIACMPSKHENITGINFGRRTRGDRIQIWFAPYTDPEVVRSLEHDFSIALASGHPQGASGFSLKSSAFAHSGSGHGGSGGPRRENREGSRRDSRPHQHH